MSRVLISGLILEKPAPTVKGLGQGETSTKKRVINSQEAPRGASIFFPL